MQPRNFAEQLKKLADFTGWRRARAQMPVVLGFVAQLLQYGSGLALVPLVVTRLSPAEVGLWYLFLTMQGLAALADFGFAPTFARSFSSAYAGAVTIQKHGLSEISGEANLPLVKQIVRSCRLFYLGVAAATLCALIVIGLLYVPVLIAGEPLSQGRVQIVWIALSVSTALTMYFSWQYGLLIGAGRIEATYLSQIVSRIGFLAAGIWSLLQGHGLVGLAVASVLSTVLARAVAGLKIKPLLTSLKLLDANGKTHQNLFSALWPNASRMGLVALGAFLITRCNVLIVSSFYDLATAATYAVSLQLLLAVSSVSQLPIQVAIPEMVRLRIRKQLVDLRRVWITRQLSLVAIFTAGLVFIVLAAQPLLTEIGSSVQVLSRPVLILLGVVLLLEVNHSSSALVITTANDVPFVAPALISGVAIVVIGSAVSWSGYGLVWLVVAQGSVQLLYNNWKWPLEAWRGLR